MDETTRPRTLRSDRAPPQDIANDPAMLALAELLDAERTLATVEQQVLVERTDAGRMWLLWFAIGATDEVCQLTGRRTERERNQVFRRVVALIFSDGVRSDVNPVLADRRLIELFETAGARAVRACLSGETRLGYYLDALRTAAGPIA
jgi:hypothetical protein